MNPLDPTDPSSVPLPGHELPPVPAPVPEAGEGGQWTFGWALKQLAWGVTYPIHRPVTMAAAKSWEVLQPRLANFVLERAKGAWNSPDRREHLMGFAESVLDTFRQNNPGLADQLTIQDIKEVLEQAGQTPEHGAEWVMQELAMAALSKAAREKLGVDLSSMKDQSPLDRIHAVGQQVVGFVTSAEGERAAAAAATQRLFPSVPGQAGSELSEDELDALLAHDTPHGVHLCERLTDLSVRFLDHYRSLDLGANPSTPRTVVDLGVDQAAHGVSGYGIGSEVPAPTGADEPFVYIPIPHPMIEMSGREVWARRDREQLTQEIRACLKLGIHNLHETFRVGGSPHLLANIMQGSMSCAGEHMTRYHYAEQNAKREGYSRPNLRMFQEAEGKRTAEPLSAVHPAMEAQTTKLRAADQLEHAQGMAPTLLQVLFPGGPASLPVPAQYRHLMYHAVLPALTSEIMQGLMDSLTQEQTVNNMLYNILKDVPAADEIQRTMDDQTVRPDPLIAAGAGAMLLQLGKLSDPRIQRILGLAEWPHRLFGGTADRSHLEQVVQQKLGEMLAVIMQNWLKQFRRPGGGYDNQKFLAWAEQTFLDSWLEQACTDFESRNWGNLGIKNVPATGQGHPVHHPDDHTPDEVRQQLSRILRDLEPYAVKAINQGIYTAQKEASNSIDNRLVRYFRKVGVQLARFKRFVLSKAGRVFRFVGRVIRAIIKAIWWFIGFEEQVSIERKQRSDDLARQLYGHLHNPEVHQNLIRHLFDRVMGEVGLVAEQYNKATASIAAPQMSGDDEEYLSFSDDDADDLGAHFSQADSSESASGSLESDSSSMDSSEEDA